MVNYICIQRERSLNPNSITLEPDRPHHDRPAACVIAHQYSPATVISLCSHFRKEKKFGAHFKSRLHLAEIEHRFKACSAICCVKDNSSLCIQRVTRFDAFHVKIYKGTKTCVHTTGVRARVARSDCCFNL